MKKLAWLLGAVALVGLAACETDDYNCDNSINCDEATQLCVTKDYSAKKVAMCLSKDKQSAYDSCGHANATNKDQWLDADGMCVSRYVSECESDLQCQTDEVCNTQTATCEKATDVTIAPKLVRIDDMSKADTSNQVDPGADIDAVVLTKANGTVVYAKEVMGYKRSDGKGKADVDVTNKMIAIDPDQALGAPDSFIGYPTNTSQCYYYKQNTTPEDKTVARPFVSLGGIGGYLIVEMGDIIEAGDTLAVLELGNCELQNTKDGGTQKGKAEAIKVMVSINQHDSVSDWSVVGDSEADVNAGEFSGIFTAKITDSMINAAK